MDEIMFSIQPKWCYLIASGKKTVEIRKSRPKLETPFKGYIYCTKPNKAHRTVCGGMVLNSDELYRHPKQGIKYGDSIELMLCDDYTKDNFLNGKVIGEFICNEITEFSYDEKVDNLTLTEMSTKSCVTKSEIAEYANGQHTIYGLHISNLVLYDTPKELSDFCVTDKKAIRDCPYREPTYQNTDRGFIKGSYVCSQKEINWCEKCLTKPLTRPFQSWGYVKLSL